MTTHVAKAMLVTMLPCFVSCAVNHIAASACVRVSSVASIRRRQGELLFVLPKRNFMAVVAFLLLNKQSAAVVVYSTLLIGGGFYRSV